MRTVDEAEVGERAEEIVDLVDAGETFAITRAGRVVALLEPIDRSDADEKHPA